MNRAKFARVLRLTLKLKLLAFNGKNGRMLRGRYM